MRPRCIGAHFTNNRRLGIAVSVGASLVARLDFGAQPRLFDEGHQHKPERRSRLGLQSFSVRDAKVSVRARCKAGVSEPARPFGIAEGLGQIPRAQSLLRLVA